MSHKPFDPFAIKVGDRVLTPDGEVITVRGVLSNGSEMYDAKLCKAAPDEPVPHRVKAAADGGDVVIWGD